MAEMTMTIDNPEYINRVSFLPAKFKAAHIVYQALLASAKVETVSIPMVDEGITAPVFRGNYGDLYNAAKLSKAHYSDVRRILTECGCVFWLQVGSAHTESVVVIDRDKLPPMSEAEMGNVKSVPTTLTENHPAYTMVVQRLEELERLVGGMNVPELAREFENRLKGKN